MKILDFQSESQETNCKRKRKSRGEWVTTVNTKVSFRGYGIYHNNMINFATVRIDFLTDTRCHFCAGHCFCTIFLFFFFKA